MSIVLDMRMSDGVEWAIHCCTVLGFVPEGGAIPAAKLAEFHGVSPTYLTKHLQALVRAGVCESVAGPRGGYRLARDADDITLLDITLAVDGERTAFECGEIRQRGPAAQDPSCYREACSIALAMWRAEEAWRAALREVSLAEIGANLAAVVHPRQLAESAVWIDQTLNRGVQS